MLEVWERDKDTFIRDIMLVQYIVSTQYMLYVYIYTYTCIYIYIHIVYTDIPEKAQMQAHLRDFCFWIVFFSI